MGGGLESRCVGRVGGVDIAVRLSHGNLIILIKTLELQKYPIKSHWPGDLIELQIH